MGPVADVELLTGDQARARWPWLSPEVRGARYRVLDPKRLSVGYATAASNAGAVPGRDAGRRRSIYHPRPPMRSQSRGRPGGTVCARRGARSRPGPSCVPDRPCAREHGRVGWASRAAADPAPEARAAALQQVPGDAPMTIEEETAAHWRPIGGDRPLHRCGSPPSEPHDPVPIEHEWAFSSRPAVTSCPRSRDALLRDVWADGAPAAHWFLQAGQYEVTPDRRPYLGRIGPRGSS